MTCHKLGLILKGEAEKLLASCVSKYAFMVEDASDHVCGCYFVQVLSHRRRVMEAFAARFLAFGMGVFIKVCVCVCEFGHRCLRSLCDLVL